ncbi:ankyrin repeat-containing protein ITN1-like [Magnolia sinica]|uniref:ankyrin repeat-containing protein ITN1-like n=1 Tax=Magnolia sinica TaxID=86752 RepID=UPI002658D503|nr:ankyrin repeat-containing protein ITN1-like [Magnolia sinica]
MDSMPRHFFPHHNNDGQTPKEIFTETHEDLVIKGGAWLTNTSQSCSVVAALIATVAFATAATVPGGVKEENGSPRLVGELAFKVYAISSVIALCLSITSIVMFLAILTSRYQEKHFARDLPIKMIRGLTSLFLSIISMLVSFCAGHFFVLEDKIKYAAYPAYIITCLPVTFLALAQFSLYIDLLRSIFTRVPQRTHKIVSF